MGTRSTGPLWGRMRLVLSVSRALGTAQTPGMSMPGSGAASQLAADENSCGYCGSTLMQVNVRLRKTLNSRLRSFYLL